jgi:uncharacterized protein (TIGR02266 family)
MEHPLLLRQEFPMRGPGSSGPQDVTRLITEFLPLNRRRLRGDPPLGVRELERWMELRERLERALGARPPLEASGRSRRRSLRVPAALRARYRASGGAASSPVGDLSEGGVFLATEAPLAPGTPLRLELEDTSGAPTVCVSGRVVWARSAGDGGGPAGMGVCFVDLDDDAGAAVATLIEGALSRL